MSLDNGLDEAAGGRVAISSSSRALPTYWTLPCASTSPLAQGSECDAFGVNLQAQIRLK